MIYIKETLPFPLQYQKRIPFFQIPGSKHQPPSRHKESLYAV